MKETTCKFGINARTARRAKDMTQADLAKVTGLTENAIHLIERRKQLPSVETAHKIATALGTSVDELMK